MSLSPHRETDGQESGGQLTAHIFKFWSFLCMHGLGAKCRLAPLPTVKHTGQESGFSNFDRFWQVDIQNRRMKFQIHYY